MSNRLIRMIDLMKRPESRLAAGAAALALALLLFVNVVLVSCEQMGGSGGGGSAGASGGDGRGAAGAPVAAPAQASSAAPADYRVASLRGEPEVRIRLLAGVDRVRLAAAGPAGKATLAPADAAGRALGGSEVKNQIELRREAGGWVVLRPDTQRILGRPSSTEHGLVFESAGGAALSINGAAHPGRIRLIPRSDLGESTFDVIEHVMLETYLPGVVAKEMPAGWPAEAYRVQAVCARTYAIHELLRARAASSRAADRWFDLESSERDQVYNGLTTNQAAVEAVRATGGMILAHQGQVLRAYFSSTCGGRTASAADTWPTGPGFEFNLASPIQARPREWACQASPLFRWSVLRDRAELVRRFQGYGEKNQLLIRKIRDLWSIEPLEFNADGRPSAFKIIEPGGVWYRLSGEQLRLAMNHAGTALAPGGLAGPGTVPGAGMMAGAAAPLPAIDRATRVNSSDVEVTGPRAGQTVTISGRGFGHGVGMCQYCARAFAQRGEGWREMVRRFYPGADVLRAY